ncbi:hypothetical protein RND81_09G039500 [Saponaria officinalis]|uniref:Uncharacterized protein n=1 Tax=Saponaria officinalis TaxID=3572 RepID=A0AAW1IHQ0_SAPOF
MNNVRLFMIKYEIEILNMEEKYVHPGRRKFRGSRPQVTNLHHFRVELFLSVIDLQLQEFEKRFDESPSELSMKIVETEKHETHSRAYMLLKLTLLLPKDLFLTVSIDELVDKFQNMRTQREQL